MKKLFALAILLIISFNGISQKTDSVKVYDEVHMKDGRVLKGEILSYSETDGFLVFRDVAGRKYSISKLEYDYFVEDKQYVVSKKKEFKLRERKENALEFGVGIEMPWNSFEGKNGVSENGQRFMTVDQNSYIPICIQLNAGKYINRKHYVGGTISYGLINGFALQNYFSVNAVYRHQYDGYKKNVAFYVPIKVGYTNAKVNLNTLYEDSTSSSSYGNEGIPGFTETVEYSLGFLNLEIGQGFSFILNDKKSIDVELSLFKGIELHTKSDNTNLTVPKLDFSNSGFKLGVHFNF